MKSCGTLDPRSRNETQKGRRPGEDPGLWLEAGNVTRRHSCLNGTPGQLGLTKGQVQSDRRWVARFGGKDSSVRVLTPVHNESATSCDNGQGWAMTLQASRGLECLSDRRASKAKYALGMKITTQSCGRRGVGGLDERFDNSRRGFINCPSSRRGSARWFAKLRLRMIRAESSSDFS